MSEANKDQTKCRNKTETEERREDKNFYCKKKGMDDY